MKIPKSFLFLILILFCIGSIYGATIKGTVTDATTRDPLPGTNVTIKNTNMGAATDLEGRYMISNIPPGNYTLRFTYIGYQDAEHNVQVTGPKSTVTQDAALKPAFIEGEEVVVSAQAQGQLSAINQQLSADAMMNVVDAARIQELPDQNVAESIARLPGITISRNNGEGSGVGIRGLSPKYNQVQIDGVSMSSSPPMGRADGFQWSQDRSVSLANISQENLSGIEVYKAITPDMDAATLGGTVNMRLGRAPTEDVNDLRLYGAYNAYRDDWKQYKLVGRISRRFFDEKFGMQLSVNAERRNRGSDRLSGWIQREDPYVDSLGTRITQYRTQGASIKNLRTDRRKQSINAIFDYATPGTELLFSNFYNVGTLTSREISREGDYLDGYRTDSESYTLSNALRGTHNLSRFEIEWQLAHFRTETETPEDYRIRWSMSGEDATELNEADKVEITPEDYLELLPDDGTWNFFRTYKDVGRIGETKYSGKLDIKYPFNFNKISGFIKMGSLVKQIERHSRLKQRSLHNGRFPDGAEGPRYADFPTDYNPDPVLNGNVSIRHFFDVDAIKPVWTDWIQDYQYAEYHPLKTDNQNYDITENYYAGYLMAKFNAFHDLLTFIPGVRYEGEEFEATGYYHYLQNRSTITFNGIYEPRTAKRSHGFWLPMVHLKVKPADWFDTRLAVTKTISRPNYRHRIPFVTASFNGDTDTKRGDPDIKAAESWNFDLSTSFYNSKFGLFTIAGFYKEIKNFSYMLDYYVADSADAVKYGLSPSDPAFEAGHYFVKNLSTPVNTQGVSTVKGIEIDYQANLRALPGLLKQITFNINYTRAFSKSWLRQYSVTLDSVVTINQPPWIKEYKTYNIGFRRGRLPTQPDHILNMAIGYEVGGFSGRFSTFFQGRSLNGVGKIEKGDTYVEDFVRYDLQLRYRVNNHLSFLVNGVNLTSTPDVTSLSGTSKHSSYDVYGSMYDFGVEYRF